MTHRSLGLAISGLALLLSGVACGSAGANLGTVWARNDSDQAYLVRLRFGDHSQPLQWQIPALSAANVVDTNGEDTSATVMDATTCTVVASWSGTQHYVGIVIGADRVVTFLTGKENLPSGTLHGFKQSLDACPSASP